MSVTISVQLPEFTAQQLDLLSVKSGISKADLIVQSIEYILAAQFDRKVSYLSDKQFTEVLNFIHKPTPADVLEKLDKTMSRAFPWERK